MPGNITSMLPKLFHTLLTHNFTHIYLLLGKHVLGLFDDGVNGVHHKQSVVPVVVWNIMISATHRQNKMHQLVFIKPGIF